MQKNSYHYTSHEEVEQLLSQAQSDAHTGHRRKWPHRHHIGRKLMRALILLISVFALILSGLLITVKTQGQTPAFWGYQLYTVNNDTMSPTLANNTTLLVRVPRDGEIFSLGDVIVYRHLSVTIMHRIVARTKLADGEMAYTTRGDRPQSINDPWTVSKNDVLGVLVWHLPL